MIFGVILLATCAILAEAVTTAQANKILEGKDGNSYAIIVVIAVVATVVKELSNVAMAAAKRNGYLDYAATAPA